MKIWSQEAKLVGGIFFHKVQKFLFESTQKQTFNTVLLKKRCASRSKMNICCYVLKKSS